MSTDVNARMPTKEPLAATLRRFVVFLVVLCMVYLFIWLPWRTNRANFLVFFGFGMVQVAATYTQNRNPFDTPPLFNSNVVSVFISILALTGLMFELVVGFGAKPWWETLLLPIPPFILSGLWFTRRNPAPPFFASTIALVIASVLKFLT